MTVLLRYVCYINNLPAPASFQKIEIAGMFCIILQVSTYFRSYAMCAPRTSAQEKPDKHGKLLCAFLAALALISIPKKLNVSLTSLLSTEPSAGFRIYRVKTSTRDGVFPEIVRKRSPVLRNVNDKEVAKHVLEC